MLKYTLLCLGLISLLLFQSCLSLHISINNHTIINEFENELLDLEAEESIKESQNDMLCKTDGKYKQLCLKKDDLPMDDLAIYQKKYDCYKDSKCLFKDDQCEWEHSDKSNDCLQKYKNKGLRIMKRFDSKPINYNTFIN